MKSQDLTKFKLPKTPGVYFFKTGREILYIGKATSLRDRTRSYFARDLIATRGPLLVDMVTRADSVSYQETDSVLEALILEANLIKKHLPKYNTKEKDNKSFNYVIITKDEWPRVLVARGRNIAIESEIVRLNAKYVFGPYPNGGALKEAMKIIRRIFPYIDENAGKKDNYQFYRQIGLAPDMNDTEARKKYQRNINNLRLFFEGKKKTILANLKKEMMEYAKKKEFEKADEIKKRIFALTHINDVSLIKEDRVMSAAFPRYVAGKPHEAKNLHARPISRIEAYDIAHMSGKNMVGVMTVVDDGEVAKSEYRKFIIRTQENSNDTGALEEVLSRRLRHHEWGMPDLIVLDGSTAQLNVGKRVLNRYQLDIPIVSVVKDERHAPKAIQGEEHIIKMHKKSILLANSEAHRFAITFHKRKRNKSFLP